VIKAVGMIFRFTVYIEIAVLYTIDNKRTVFDIGNQKAHPIYEP
jgi:hypothetical protein